MREWIPLAGPNLITYQKAGLDVTGSIDQFEEMIDQYCEPKKTVALNSGTSAIHMALITLGVDPGDEVICSALTYSASANPILYQGAKPVFVDSEYKTWNIDPAVLGECIEDRLKRGKKPKAIILVHLFGMPAQFTKIKAIAEKYEIPIIEDAAEALGAEYFDRKLGTLGDIGIFSFNNNKIVTTLGGGCLVSGDEKIVNRVRYLSTQAKDPLPYYHHTAVGYNYRISPLCAHLGLSQFPLLNRYVSRKRAIFNFYRNQLDGLDGLYFLNEPNGCFSNRWLTVFLIDPAATGGISRDDIREALLSEFIESRPIWNPLHLQPVFKNFHFYGNRTSDVLFKNGLCLPSGNNLTDKQLLKVTHVIRSVLM